MCALGVEGLEKAFYRYLPLEHQLLLEFRESDPEEKSPITSSDPEGVARGRKLLQNHHKASRIIRSRYKISDGVQIEFDEETIEELRSLGYVI